MSRFWIGTSSRLFVISAMLIFAASLGGTRIASGTLLAYTTDRGIGLSDVDRWLSGLLVNDPDITAGESISWSPDGQKLAFQAGHEKDGVFDLDVYVISIADFSVRNISQSPRIDEPPLVWSPDNKMLGFVSRTETIVGNRFTQTDENRFQVVNVIDGKILFQFTREGNLYEVRMSLSSTGIRISFVSSDIQGRLLEVFKGNLESSPTKIFQYRHNPTLLTWSPNDRLLMFNTEEADSTGLQVADTEMGTLRQLDSSVADRLVWSPDNQHIAYNAWKQQSGGLPDTGLYITDVTSGELQALTAPSTNDFYPTWLPDGQHLLVDSNRDGYPAFWLLDRVTGTATRIITRKYGYLDIPVLSTNGRWLAFFAYNAQVQNNAIYIVDILNPSVSQLVTGNFPVWQP